MKTSEKYIDVSRTVLPEQTASSPFRNVDVFLVLLIPATLIGFWKTYFGVLDHLPEWVTPVIQIHSALMVLWLLMLPAQAWFIRTGRRKLHRWVGRSSYGLVPVILWFGLAATQESLHRRVGDEFPEYGCAPTAAFDTGSQEPR